MGKRYFFWFTAAFLTGIGFAAKGGAYCFLPAGLLLLGMLYFWKTRKIKMFVSLLLGVLVGTVCFIWHFSVYRNTISVLKDQNVVLIGRIEHVKESERLRLLVRGEVYGDNLTEKNISVYVYPETENLYTYGDMIHATGYLNVPKAPSNFGETDYRLYSMGKNISASMYPGADNIQIQGNVISAFHPRDIAYRLRKKVQDILSLRLDAQSAGFLRAYLTGDKSVLMTETDTALRGAGLSHIVAVSGLHLQAILNALLLFFGILKIKKRLFSTVFYLIFIWFFVLFSGASASVMRAALMLTVFFFAGFMRRDHDGITALAFAAFSMCLANPGTLFDVGFQLSCASTLSILLFRDKTKALFRFLPHFLQEAAAMSAAAYIGFMPLVAAHFGTYCTVGLLANLMVAPLTGPLLVIGFLGILLAEVPLLSDVLFFLLTKGTAYILWTADFCASMPFATIPMRKPGMLFSAGYILSACGLYLLSTKRWRQILLCFIVGISFVNIELVGYLVLKQITTVTFLSVGNGDCALLTGRDGVLLFDSGGNQNGTVAKNTVIPYLRRQGIQKIDAAFLTHYHTDHGKGYLGLLEAGYVNTLFLPYHDDDELKPLLQKAARKAGTKIKYLGDGDVISVGRAEVECFDSKAGNAENAGFVFKVRAENTDILLTGDIDHKAERRLLYKRADMECDILKVAHHGAESSSLPEFIECISPDLAVVSCGANSYGHPHRKTLDTFAHNGIPVFRTDKNGTVRIYLLSGGRRKIDKLYE